MNLISEGQVFIFTCSAKNDRLISELGESVSLEDREKRTRSLIEALDEDELSFLHRLKTSEKRSDKSKILRLEGNRYFQSIDKGSLDKAVEEYTKAVAHAPNGSEDLGLAYANRSAALFKARLISDCLLDIGRALENNYPDNLKAKLFLRKAMCLQILESNNDSAIKDAFNEARKWTKKMNETKQSIMIKMLEEQEHEKSIDKSTFSKWPYKKFMPKLDAENPKIPGLSDAVELKYSKKYGRHMVATRNFKPGEVICIQKAYAKAVFPCSKYYLCWNCGEQTWASLPCERCVEVIFCSESCREEGNREYHNIECPIVSSLTALQGSGGLFLPLKILLKAFREANDSFKILKRNVEEIDAEKDPVLKGFKNNIFDPTKFASIYSLSLTSNKKIIFNSSAEALLLASLLAIKTDFFGSKLIGGLKNLKTRDNFIFIVALIEKIWLISSCNQNTTRGQVYGNKTYSMIVPVYSFFNHSCYNSTETTFHGDYLANVVNVPIKKGQQIFGNYGQHFEYQPLDIRRQHLLENYCFSCDCEGCEYDWPQEPVYELSSLELMNNSVRGKLIKKILDIKKKYVMIDGIASSFGPKHGQIYDSRKDISAMVGIIEALYRVGFKPYSYESRMAKSLLESFLIFNENRYLSLN